MPLEAEAGWLSKGSQGTAPEVLRRTQNEFPGTAKISNLTEPMTSSVSGSSGFPGEATRGGSSPRHRQDFRELEIDDAEAAGLGVVGDVARLGVEVADAVVALEVGE